MMARQSALSTRNVQKLKDKAKSSAEKRLKQLRKDQLKAIKLVEKDEKYLMKLSSNRRPLQAAHSISDIKLVGRCDGHIMNYLPFNGSCLPHSEHKSSCLTKYNKASTTCISSIGSNRHLAPDMGKFNSKLTSHKSNIGLDYDSAYSSSSVSMCSKSNRTFSIGSGSYGASSNSSQTTTIKEKIIKNFDTDARPKYSDLVAIPAIQPTDVGNPVMREMSQPKRTKGISVSTKMQIRRLMKQDQLKGFNDKACEMPETKRGQIKKLPTSDGFKTGLKCHSSVFDLSALQSAKVDELKSCDKVQISLENTHKAASYENETTDSIKWPPPPSLTRASSEPEIVKLPFTQADKRDQAQNDDQDRSQLALETRPVDVEANKHTESDGNLSMSLNDKVGKEPKIGVDKKCDEVAISQHHIMLNQCLSQLRLHHKQLQSNQESVHKTSRPQLRQANSFLGNPSSNELLQHQRNAGELPLKPSLIKQHQRANCQVSLPAPFAEPERLVSSQLGYKKSTTQSARVDSIGSVSSLAQRNASSASSKVSSGSSITSSASSWSHRSGSDSSRNCEATQRDYKSSSLATSKPDQYIHSEADQQTIDMFLNKYGLTDLSETFAREKIDLEALMLLTEDDLKSINILLGPRRKLLRAVERYQASEVRSSDCIIVDTEL